MADCSSKFIIMSSMGPGEAGNSGMSLLRSILIRIRDLIYPSIGDLASGL